MQHADIPRDEHVFVCRRVIEHTRSLDATRPVTFAMSGASSASTDKVVRTGCHL